MLRGLQLYSTALAWQDGQRAALAEVKNAGSAVLAAGGEVVAIWAEVQREDALDMALCRYDTPKVTTFTAESAPGWRWQPIQGLKLQGKQSSSCHWPHVNTPPD